MRRPKSFVLWVVAAVAALSLVLVGCVESMNVLEFTRPPDPYAAYDGQRTCINAEQPGVVDFKNMVLALFPSTSSLGIRRSCDAKGRSEHKEGRAWDWKVNANDPEDRRKVDILLDLLLQTRDGQPHAFARRLGIMYIIWNHRIWKAYPDDNQPSGSWHPYAGDNPHTDHVHFSFSWTGARRQTTWWTARKPKAQSLSPAPVLTANLLPPSLPLRRPR